MNNKKHELQSYACYGAGIHLADLEITEQGLFIKKRDLYTNAWGKLQGPTDTTDLLGVSLQQLWQCVVEQKDLDLVNSEEILLGTDYQYSRYLKVTGDVKGKITEGWIWASRKAKFPVDLVTVAEKIIALIIPGRNQGFVVVKPGYEKLTPLKEWQEDYISPAEFGVDFKGTSLVAMRDGVKLATDVYLPAKVAENAKIPAILIRTPYGKGGGVETWIGFVKRGYALVIQDVRGREDSEGAWIPFVNEIDDGGDTVEWVARQKWCDGQVGMIGGSYLGYVQWAAAASGTPHLKALVSLVTAGSPFVDMPRRGGTYQSGVLSWAAMVAEKRTNFQALERDDWEEILAHRPLKDIPRKAFGKDLYFWDQWMQHPHNDEFWQRADYTLQGEKIDIPSLLVSGWYDDNGMGTTQAWEMNQNNKRKNQRLILGPWLHKSNSTRVINEVEFGNNALRYDLDLLYLQWFDRFLKGIVNGVEQGNIVEYYVVGENQWRTDQEWPPHNVVLKRLYLDSHGDARTSQGKGTLTREIPQNKEEDPFIYDPTNPCPYLIDVSENECSVPDNYNKVEERDDVLVYTTPPLDQEVVIAGDVYAEFYASTSAPDTDWVVRLTDVDEKGNSIRLSDGIIRAKYRNSYQEENLLEPHSIAKYRIRMTRIANMFKKGHRIRVEITSSADKQSFPNSNTGNDPWEDVEVIIAIQKVHHGGKYQSFIELPIIAGELAIK